MLNCILQKYCRKPLIQGIISSKPLFKSVTICKIHILHAFVIVGYFWNCTATYTLKKIAIHCFTYIV